MYKTMYSQARVYYQTLLKCKVETVKRNGKFDTTISSSSGSTLLNLYGQSLLFSLLFSIAIFVVIVVVTVFYQWKKSAVLRKNYTWLWVSSVVVASQFKIVYILVKLFVTYIALHRAFENRFLLLGKTN